MARSIRSSIPTEACSTNQLAMGEDDPIPPRNLEHLTRVALPLRTTQRLLQLRELIGMVPRVPELGPNASCADADLV